MNNLALDKKLMFKAIKEAKRGIPHVYPNPAVGCVIHDGGKILIYLHGFAAPADL